MRLLLLAPGAPGEAQAATAAAVAPVALLAQGRGVPCQLQVEVEACFSLPNLALLAAAAEVLLYLLQAKEEMVPLVVTEGRHFGVEALA